MSGAAAPPHAARPRPAVARSLALVSLVAAAAAAPASARGQDDGRAAAGAPPADVAAFLERAETCAHLAGEEPYDDARRDELARGMLAARCEALEADARALLRAHRGSPAARAVASAMEPLGGVEEAPDDVAVPHHCAPAEERVFTCRAGRGDKVLSICAAPSLGARAPRLAYRYGRLGAVELQYPRKAVSPSRAFWFSAAGDGGGTLRFVNGRTAYELVVGGGTATLFVYPKDGSKPMPIACAAPLGGGLPPALAGLIGRPVP